MIDDRVDRIMTSSRRRLVDTALSASQRCFCGSTAAFMPQTSMVTNGLQSHSKPFIFNKFSGLGLVLVLIMFVDF